MRTISAWGVFVSVPDFCVGEKSYEGFASQQSCQSKKSVMTRLLGEVILSRICETSYARHKSCQAILNKDFNPPSMELALMD